MNEEKPLPADTPATDPSAARRQDGDRDYDVVILGATGFTGELTAAYLAEHAPAGLRWALAGRNRGKLESVRARLAKIDPALTELPLLEADSSDDVSLRAMAESTRVVVTTVGPYLQFGEPLVAACAAAGTDYVDLTGEPEFVDRMYLEHHDRAVASGARIVHACGFDSIPHDIGAYYTVQQLGPDHPIKLRGVVRAGAMASGGTFHSAMGAISRASQMRQAMLARRKKEGRPEGRKSRAVAGKPHRDKSLGLWLLPLPTIDPFVVARSGAALESYGPDFRYSHYAGLKTLRYTVGGAAAVVRAGRCGADQAAAQLPQEQDQAGGRPLGGARARTRGSPWTSSERAPGGPCTPGSPAGTPATRRPRRCSPSRLSAWPSTTTRRPRVRSPPPPRWPRTSSPGCRRPG